MVTGRAIGIYVIMFVLGLAIAQIVGLIFSDEPWRSFIVPGVLMGIGSIASVQKHHVTSLMLSLSAALLLMRTIAWDTWTWLWIPVATLTVIALAWWFFHHGPKAPTGGAKESE